MCFRCSVPVLALCPFARVQLCSVPGPLQRRQAHKSLAGLVAGQALTQRARGGDHALHPNELPGDVSAGPDHTFSSKVLAGLLLPWEGQGRHTVFELAMSFLRSAGPLGPPTTGLRVSSRSLPKTENCP